MGGPASNFLEVKERERDKTQAPDKLEEEVRKASTPVRIKVKRLETRVGKKQILPKNG